jgi:hypothetical protein
MLQSIWKLLQTSNWGTSPKCYLDILGPFIWEYAHSMALPYTKAIQSLNIPLHMEKFLTRHLRECGDSYKTSHVFGLSEVLCHLPTSK